MMRKYTSFWFLVVLLVGCTQLGLEKPDTTPQRLAYTLTAITEVREATLHLLEVKRIKPEDARKVQTLADVARRVVDQASTLYFATPSDKSGALRALETAESMVTEIQQLLQAKTVRP